MGFWILLILSALFSVVGLRHKVWWFFVIAMVLALPIAVVAHVAFGVLMLVPLLQLAIAIVLRRRLHGSAIGGIFLAVIVLWFVGVGSAFLLHWKIPFAVVPLLALAGGSVLLAVPPRAVRRVA